MHQRVNAAAKAKSVAGLLGAAHQESAQPAQVRMGKNRHRLDQERVERTAPRGLRKIGNGEQIADQFAAAFGEKKKLRPNAIQQPGVLRYEVFFRQLGVEKVAGKCNPA